MPVRSVWFHPERVIRPFLEEIGERPPMPVPPQSQVTDHVHALFTAYHPFLGSVSVYIEGPTPPPLPATLAPAIVGGEAVSPVGGHDFDITAQPNCAYIMWLSVTLNLTHGYGSFLGDLTDHVAFCKG